MLSRRMKQAGFKTATTRGQDGAIRTRFILPAVTTTAKTQAVP